MRAIAFTALAFSTLAGCAAPVEPTPLPQAGVDPTVVEHPPLTESLGNDCAVIAAVAKEHYRFNETDNRPLPIRFEGDYAPRCDWSRHGLAFEPYDPDRPHQPGDRIQWVSFKQPRYDGRGAVIETGILHGPLAGMGYECRVHSGFAGWTVGECRNTWIS